MIIELFGLPGSGKSTRARAWSDGKEVVRVHTIPASALLLENLRFALQYPLRSVRLALWLFRAPRSLRRGRFINLFLIHNAKYLRANRLSRAGKIAIIDQGHFQNLLSLFGDAPSDALLARYLALLPRPDLVAVCEVPDTVRRARVQERDHGISLEEDVIRVRSIAEAIYPRVLALMRAKHVPHRIVPEGTALHAFLTERITYATIARMPTEKAHGASIAHLCAAFAKCGSQVELVVPRRRNPLSQDVFEYYGVPRNFTVRSLPVFDYVGRGFTHAYFFFLQRLAFVRALKRAHLAPGIVYTREPEIAAAFSHSHYAVLELHRWPKGGAGNATARLARRAALVVCNSSGTEAAANAAGVRRTVVAPNGFDPESFARAQSKSAARARLALPEGKVALYVGSLEAHKGVGTLYAAAELLPEISVAVIGGDDSGLLQARYPKVHFLGPRPYRELADNLAAADVLILPNTATDEESAHFTSPIKVFGYMASRRPIVASDLPSLRETLDESSAFFVAPDDPQALAAGIRRACVEHEEAERRTAAAHALVQEYTWEHRARRILDALTKP